MSDYLATIVKKQKQGQAVGMISICSANRFAIKSAMLRALKNDVPVVIEATANQVDQNGGYSGLTPAAFISYVYHLAEACGFPCEKIVLGGDHLGPLTRRQLPENEAMAYAERLVREYVLAGFTKIHLDTSMKLGSDPADQPLTNEKIAERGARLCQAAEQAYVERQALNPESQLPVYIIGSEVPIPGGTQSEEELARVTSPEHCMETISTYRSVFSDNGLQAAFQRVIAIVVQTGAEFGDEEVFLYNSKQAAQLVQYGKRELAMVFEGHSTDYQTADSLKAMVQDGIAILKVGPALTFALREALYALEMIEREIYYGKTWVKSNFSEVLEMSMMNDPENWKNHYHGDVFKLRSSRRFSYSDRARYYIANPDVEQSIQQLINNIDRADISRTMFSQYLPRVYEKIGPGKGRISAESLILEHIGCYLDDYYEAILQS